MNVNDWHERWEKNHIGFHRADTNPLLLKYFNKLDLKPHSRIFVPLCGKSIDMLWLVDKGHDVVGVEISEIACEAFFRENALQYQVADAGAFKKYSSTNITLYAGDYFALTAEMLGHIDAVYDRAALIALPGEMRKQYVEYLFTIVGTSIKILLITMAYNQDEMEGPPFSVGYDEIHGLYADKLSINPVHEQFYTEVAKHLRVKGLTGYTDLVYVLS